MILGADISTTHIGITVLDQSGSIVVLDHIDFNDKEREDVWVCVDKFKKFILDKFTLTPTHIKYVFVEEPKISFSMGKTTSNVMMKLMRFNSICSYALREIFGIKPEYVAESTARKECGVKVSKKERDINGTSYKKQTFEQMIKTDQLKNIKWDLKRTGNYKDYNYDMVDSYIVALYGLKKAEKK